MSKLGPKEVRETPRLGMPMLCRWLKPLVESGSRVPRRRLNAMVVLACLLLLAK